MGEKMFYSRSFALILLLLVSSLFVTPARANDATTSPITTAYEDKGNVVLQSANGVETVLKPDGPPIKQPKTEQQPDGSVVDKGTKITSYGGGTVKVVGNDITVNHGDGSSTTFDPKGFVTEQSTKDGVTTIKIYNTGVTTISDKDGFEIPSTLDKDGNVVPVYFDLQPQFKLKPDIDRSQQRREEEFLEGD